MISEPAPIKRRKLAHEVEERLLALMQNSHLRPGDHIPSERELMTQYQVGRPAIREAMQNLQRMGLIEIRHGERPKVAQPSMSTMIEQMSSTMHHLLAHSPATMEHLKQARATFEGEMARIAARQASPAQVEALWAAFREQERLRDNPAGFLAADGSFHRTLAAISGNPIFESLSHALFGWLANFHIDMVHQPGAELITLAEHRAIVEAVARGAADEAAQAMLDHINRANALYHQTHLTS